MTAQCCRTSCRADLADPTTERYCSDECRKVGEALKRVPTMPASINAASSNAAVRFAFPWLDVRAQGVRS